MKKTILVLALLVSTLSINAQEFNLGLSGALPVGDAGDFTTFGVNLDLNYLTEISEQFDLGVATGYQYYFGEEISGFELDDISFLPIAAAARFNATESLTLGADIGYAIGISPDGNDGGFYYAPKLQYGVTETLDLVLAYKAISLDDNFSFGALTLGVEFGL